MKVLHYKSNFLNYSETFIKRLIEHHKQFTPAAMCFEKQSLSPDCEIYEVPKSGFKSSINNLYFHLNWGLPFYNSVIKNYNPRIIHAHFGFDGYRMIKPSKKADIPLIVSFYGSDVSRLPSEFDWKRRYQKLAAHGDAFIAASTLMKKQLVGLGFPEPKIKVVRFGIDLNQFVFNYSYSPQSNIMMVGRMVEKKGFIYAFKAIKILKKQGRPVYLDLFGDGTLRKKLEEKAHEWHIDELITFHGRQPIHKIRRAYHNHSLLLIPSITANDGDTEGIPNTLLEGMASGIPVLGTNHSAIPEVICHKKTGLLAEEKDYKTIAEMIYVIKKQKIDITTLRKKARQQIKNYYEINRMVKRVEHIYDNVLD